MKLKRWLALSLAAALVLSAVHGQYRVVSAEETGEGTVTTENETLNEAEKNGEDQTPETAPTAEDEKTLKNASSERGGVLDQEQSTEKDEDTEENQNSGNHLDAENEQDSIEKEEMNTGGSEVVSSEETPADTAAPEENELLKTEEPAADEADVENETLDAAAEDGAGAPAAQAGDIASGTDGNINWRIDADGKLTASGTGDFTNGVPWRQYRTSIISAEINVSGMVDASGMFSGCQNLINVNLENLDTSAIEDMNRMFSNCSHLTNLTLSCANNVRDMSYMFWWCTNLENLNLDNLDTSNVTDMQQMFLGCNSLTNLNLANFNTHNVINMYAMFAGCEKLRNLDLSNFDTVNVTNMCNMFENCHELINLNLSSFNTENVIDMSRMFYDCSNLITLDLSSFDTLEVINMGSMFYGCSNLTALDLSNFDTSSVINMSCMFQNCSNLATLDLSSFDTLNVDDMGRMFRGCNSLTTLDVSGFNTSKVTDMSFMFELCISLTRLDLSSFDTTQITDMEYTFSIDSCRNLTEIHTPYNMNVSVALPAGPDIFWLLPDGTEVTEFPQNLPHSVTITRRRNPKIITTTPDLNMSDVVRVKYVPYSYTVRTDNWDENNIVTYSLAGGELAEGLELYPATGEIYGIPLEAGEFPIRVKAEFSNPEYLPSYADLTLTVLDNTDGNVSIASDLGYEVERHLGTQLSGADGIYYAVQERTDQLFVSAGENGEFYDLWLNGVKLTENEDYTRESGSTRITVRSQTLENKTNKDGVNTIAAEFRVGGDRGNDLKRTAQNFRIDFQQGGGSGDDFQQGSSSGGGSRSGRGGSGGGSSEEGVVSVSSATAVVRLVNAAGNPLTGVGLELHSTPQTAQTDRRGTAVFAGVTAGLHTLYVKDGAGNILASRKFELLFGDKVLVNADQVTAKAGGVFTVQVQMKEKELAFLSAQEGDVYRVASAGTGDEMEAGPWLLLLLLSGVLSCGLCAGCRKRRMY